MNLEYSELRHKLVLTRTFSFFKQKRTKKLAQSEEEETFSFNSEKQQIRIQEADDVSFL